MQILPLLFLGLIIFFSVTSAKARRQQQEAIRKAAEARRMSEAEQKPAPSEPERKPVPKPVASKPAPAKKNTPVRNNAAQKKAEPIPYNAERAAVKENKHPAEEKTIGGQQSGQILPPLKWDRNAAMQGIVYAEILGKPKALRHK